MDSENPREIAIRVLRRRVEHGEYIERLLENEPDANRLKPVDRALCQELVYGLVRWQTTLDWLVARKTSHRPPVAPLRLLLHLGLYQLFWLQRIPDHAAVHETVELCKRLGFRYQSGFLNAVLRGYIRDRDATVSQLENLRKTDPATGYSHPAWLVEKWNARWGEATTVQLLQWNNTPPSVYARLNQIKADPAALAAAWKLEQVTSTERTWDWTGGNTVLELNSHPPLMQCESFRQGFFYAQDPSTLLAVTELNPQPGENILDLCAAPGGKTSFIAQLMQNRGVISAWDNQPERLELVRVNCARLGVICVEYSGTDREGWFDRILVDAPCSNTGVLRRRVDLRWRIKPDEIDRLRQTQSELLEQAAPRLKAGGTLVYSTCSLESEENEEVIRRFLDGHAEFKLKKDRQLTPFTDGVDGAYVAAMVKSD